MKTSPLKPIIIFLFFLLKFSPAMAQNTLQKDEIEKYLAAMPQIRQLAETYQQEQEEPQKADTTLNNEAPFSLTPMTDSLAKIKEHPTYQEFLKIIKNAGFRSAEEWANVGDQIMKAYSAFKLKNPQTKASPNLSELESTLQNQLKEVRNNQFISPEQKQFIVNKLQKSIALLNDPNYINSQNINIIAPYINRLDSLLRNTNDTY